MSLLTPLLKLFKWDTTDEADLNSEFDIDTSMNDNWDKIDNFAGQANNAVMDIQDDIEDIQNKDTEQDKLIQKLQANMIQESTEEATSLHVEDASDLPAVLSIAGNHYQETQEGTSNLAVLNEGSVTQDGITVDIENGNIKVNGTNTTTETLIFNVGTVVLTKGETYYIKRLGTINGTGIYLNNSGTQVWGQVTETSFVANATGVFNIALTIGTNAINNTTQQFLVSKISGANWEEGKAAIPSLYYPSEIKTVSGSQKIIISGNNIFDNQMEKGDITAYSGVNASSTTRIRSKNYISLFNMKKIRIIRDDGNSTTTIGLRFYDKDKNFLGYSTAALTGLVDLTSILSNILAKGAKYFRFVVVDETDLTKKYGINLDNSTEFIEHEQKEYNLSVQQEMLQNDYFDLTNIKETHNYEKKNMSELAWQVSANTLQEKTFDFVVMFSNEELLSTEINCFSNSFKSETASYLNSNDEEGIGQSKSQIICRIGKEKVADLNAFKTLLAEKNAVVYVKTRSELDLTEEQKEVLQQLNNLELFKRVNNIYTEQNLALLKLDYTADTKIYIDNKIASQNKEILNVAGGN